MAEITLEELLKEDGVHPERLNESITDDHLHAIAIFLTSWRKVATYLELSENDLDDVEQEGKDEQDKRLKALQMWKRKIGFKATYRKLVEVLLSLAMADVAEKICLLLKGGDEPLDTTPTIPEPQPFKTECSPRWIAETSVMVFNQSQIFNWEGYGVKLHIPQGMLPGSLKECKLLIKVGLSGKFEFPQNTSLVSAVYLIDSEPRCKFSQPLTLEMQHCVQSSQTSRLNFARCSRNSPPYTFEILEGGEFSSQSAYGRIQLQSFSLIALLLTMLPWWARIFGDENVKYRARLYYLMKRVDRREIHFLITKDLDTYATKIQRKYRGATIGPDFPLEFNPGNSITLQPSSAEDGWRIDPLFPPVIMKEDVDSCGIKNEIPHCELSAEWTRPGELPSHLKREVILEGAKKPYDRFLIVIDTPLPEVTRHQSTLSDGSMVYSQVPTLKDLMTALYRKVAHKWKAIGIYLEISDLDSIETKHRGDTHLCLLEMLDAWLKRVDPPPTWSAIIDAVEFLGEEQLGRELRNEYI